MGDALVIGKRLSRSFKHGIVALRDVDCRIASDARIAVIGPSGSGKTTLLHILGGLDTPTAGNIEWPGLGPFDQLRPRHVGFVFQTPSLFPALTVAQNVGLPLVLAGDPASAEA